MIAAACVAARLEPSAFDIDPEDRHVVAEAILHVLKEQADKLEQERLAAKLKGS